MWVPAGMLWRCNFSVIKTMRQMSCRTRWWRCWDPSRSTRPGGSFKSWFLTVVRNRCLDLLRQRRPQVAIDEVRMAASPSSDPESAFEQDEMQAILKWELRRLPTEQREFLILREYLDLTYAEIGKVLGVPPGTVMS